MGKFNIKKYNGVFYVISVLILLYLIFKIGIYLLPFVFAMGIVAMINPIISFLKRRLNIDNGYLKAIILAIFYLTIGSLVVWGIVSTIIEGYRFSKYILDNQKIILNAIRDFIEGINSLYVPKTISDYLNSLTEKTFIYLSKEILVIANTLLALIRKIPNILIFIIIMVIASFRMISSEDEIEQFLKKQIPLSWLEKFYEVKKGVFHVMVGYLKAQFKLIAICFFELLIGLTAINLITGDVSYIFLYSFVICFLDALPLIGASIILVPWGIISIASGSYLFGVLILLLEICIWGTRQVLEPKLISVGVKMHPLFALISIYVGLEFFGLLGVLIGPIVFSILKVIFYEEIKFGFFKFLVGDKE